MNYFGKWNWKFAMGALLLLPGISWAQQPQITDGDELSKIIPPNPQVAALGTYGSFNNDLAVGQVNISVPLASVQSYSLGLAIGLSYNHTGIKVTDVPGTTGASWNLTGLGSISRTVVGLPDEWSGGFESTSSQNMIANRPNSPTWTPMTFADLWYNAVTIGNVDLEPDLYSYNFNGKSGKFFYNAVSGKFVTMPYAPIQIARTGTSVTAFEIVDENGYKFVFDKTGTATTEAVTHTTEWYLTFAYAPDGKEEYNINYTEDPGNIQTSVSEVMNYLMPGSYIGCGGGNFSGVMISQNGAVTATETTYDGKLPSGITTPTESVSFTYGTRSDGRARLDAVEHSSKINNETRTQYLYYSAFSGNGKSRLDSVASWAGGQRFSAYSFGYDNTKPLPPTGSKGQDHWGFNNGKVFNTSLVPKVWYGTQYIGVADREPFFADTKAGVLTSITYPTGGSSAFTYELNDYSLILQTEQVNEPIFSNKNLFLKRDSIDNVNPASTGTTTATFYIDAPQVIHWTSYRDACNGDGRDCSNEACTASIMISGAGISGTGTMSLNGVAKESESGDLYINQACTLTVTIFTEQTLDYGRVSIDYSESTGTKKIAQAGGLRIAKITNNDGLGHTSVRKFSYPDASDEDRSSGVLLQRPYYINLSQSKSACPPGGLGNCNATANNLRLTSNSNRLLFFNGGTVVSYKRVMEQIGENGEGGYIDHRFSYVPDGVSGSYPYASPSLRFWKRGLPVQTLYTTAGHHVVREELRSYEAPTHVNYTSIIGVKLGIAVSCGAVSFGNEIAIMPYEYRSEWHYPKTVVTREYLTGSIDPLETTETYYYDNPAHCNATRVVRSMSDGREQITRMKYPQDYTLGTTGSDPATATLISMVQKNMISPVVETTSGTIQSGTESIHSASVQTFKEFATGKIYPWKQFRLETAAPVALPSGGFSSISSNTFQLNSQVKPQIEFTQYTPVGSPLSAVREHGAPGAYIWNYNHTMLAAYAQNAVNGQIAYTGFESGDGGNWLFNPFGLDHNGGVTGNTAYDLSRGSFDKLSFESAPGIPATGDYLITYWKKNGRVTVNGANPSFTGETANGWTYCEHLLTSTINASIAGDAIIDDLRAYPANARMKTFTYKPLFGVSATCDENSKINFYEYDALGRLVLVKDQNGNILSKNQYGIQTGE